MAKPEIKNPVNPMISNTIVDLYEYGENESPEVEALEARLDDEDTDDANELLLEGVGCIRDSVGEIVEGEHCSKLEAVADTRAPGSSTPYKTPTQTTFDFSLRNRKLITDAKDQDY